MAYAKISLNNGVEVKTAPVGYSWTTLFFGGWPGIFRQDWLWGILLIIACMFTWGLAGIVCSFFYNKVYINGLIKRGFKIDAIAGTTEESLKSYLGLMTLPRTSTAVVSSFDTK